jgi:osmotically-inducible protein OsmY
MMSSKQNPKQHNLTNDGIQANIWDALREDETIRPLDLGSLSIKVELGEVYMYGYLKQENQPLVESTIQTVLGVVEVHNHLRTDDGILADIWDVLWQEDSIRSLDLGSLSIDVKDGEVYLYGHIAQENNLPRIESIALSIAGVVSVHNYLVTDRDLTIQVTGNLARDERTRPFIIPVNAFHGWIQLGGEVPNRELQHVAEKVAGEVSGVRGVIAMPRITGESPTPPKRTMQPRIGAVVYARDLEEGVITQVVIRPEDRLITHVVVRSNEIKDGNLVTREIVVPVQDVDRADNESIFLRRKGPSLSEYPLFDPDEFPLAPFTWQAPYPYTAGKALWSLREILEVASQPGSQTETEAQVSAERPSKQVTA